MKKGRVEAFSDGVIAIIITIMVLELKTPHEVTFHALAHLFPVLLSYLLSFIYVGIYWNNHHHLFHAVTRVTGPMLWANLHLLFWLSLIPFVTGWMGENHFEEVPTVVYGIVLLMCSIAFWILQRVIIADHGENSVLQKALGKDLKGKISMGLYVAAIMTALYQEWIGQALLALVALMWLVPDSRIERALDHHNNAE